MAAVCDLGGEFWMALRSLANCEEGGVDAPVFQQPKDFWSYFGIGAIVEGESNLWMVC
jgi:hypothetical protein